MTAEQTRDVQRAIRRGRFGCAACGNRSFVVGDALYLSFLFLSEQQDSYMVALTCTNPMCPAPRTGITLHGLRVAVQEAPSAAEPAPKELRGRPILDSSEEPIGRVLEVYVDGESGAATWGLIRTGLLRTKKRFAPLSEASLSDGHVEIPVEGRLVRRAPAIPTADTIGPDDEQRLLEHYHLGPVPLNGATSSAHRLHV